MLSATPESQCRHSAFLRSDCQTADDVFLFDCALALVKGCHLRKFAQKSKSGKLKNFFINALVRVSNLIFT